VKKLPLTAKIWLSIAIFILGFVVSTTLGQWQGISRENALAAISSSSFPAAQRSQRAQAAFHNAIKEFNDAILVQDPAALKRADSEGLQASSNLSEISSTPGLLVGRSGTAKSLC
jgi:uncharacterized MAPEG superfamily protein